MYKKNIKLIALAIMIFLVIGMILPFVSSAPPVTTVQQLSVGYGLETPTMTFLEQNKDYSFEFHVYNLSNGVPITSGISCYFHLYNETGKHSLTMEDTTVDYLFDYGFDVKGANFSVAGTYAFVSQCNSSTLGSPPVKIYFQVTPSGQENLTGNALIYAILLIVLLVFLIGCVVIFMESENLLARVGSLGIGYLLLIAVNFVAWNMANDFLLANPFIAEMFRILFFTTIIGAFPLLIGAFVWYFIMLWKIKEIERLMGKGFSEDDARRRTSR